MESNYSYHLTWDDIYTEVSRITKFIAQWATMQRLSSFPLGVYGVPRGGIIPALLVVYALKEETVNCRMVEDVREAHIIIDDVCDSGETKERFTALHPKKGFYTIVDKQGRHSHWKNRWVVFPWERMQEEKGPEENIKRILEYIGDDVNREGLQETPHRVVKSYEKLFGGYKQEPKDVVKVFRDSYDEIVLLKDIEFYSTCEHHMLPFFGRAHIAYIPLGQVVGVSKLARILEIYTRRLQIQERICQQVTAALDDLLEPKGSACILEAQHFCMTSRGIEKQKSVMVTSSLTGPFQKNPNTRNELMNLIKER